MSGTRTPPEYDRADTTLAASYASRALGLAEAIERPAGPTSENGTRAVASEIAALLRPVSDVLGYLAAGGRLDD